MIAYEKLPLDNEVKAALEGLEIEYVFQPIFYKDFLGHSPNRDRQDILP